MYDHTFSKIANHQIKPWATHIVGCQPGDCVWSLQFSSEVCVGIYSCDITAVFGLLRDLIAQMPTNKESYCVWANRGLEQG